MHSPQALRKIADRLSNAYQTAKDAGLTGDALKMAVCEEPDKIRDELSKGTFDLNAP